MSPKIAFRDRTRPCPRARRPRAFPTQPSFVPSGPLSVGQNSPDFCPPSPSTHSHFAERTRRREGQNSRVVSPQTCFSDLLKRQEGTTRWPIPPRPVTLTDVGGRKGLWMTSYRYVVFPRGRQPSVAEVQRLEQFAGALANQLAWGVCRDEPRLALAVDARAFDHVKSSDAGFEALIETWRSHGAELADHLQFVKDKAALKPVRATSAMPLARQPRADANNASRHEAASVTFRSEDARLAAKRTVAHEAIARSWLGVSQTLERYEALQRFAAVFPYVMILAAIAATAGVGLYIRGKLTAGGYEPRQQTIERAIAEPADASSGEEPEP